MNKQEIKEKKEQVKRENLCQETLLLNRRKMERKCFWTWPWGHTWRKGKCYPGGIDDHCFICKKLYPSDY